MSATRFQAILARRRAAARTSTSSTSSTKGATKAGTTLATPRALECADRERRAKQIRQFKKKHGRAPTFGEVAKFPRATTATPLPRSVTYDPDVEAELRVRRDRAARIRKAKAEKGSGLNPVEMDRAWCG